MADAPATTRPARTRAAGSKAPAKAAAPKAATPAKTAAAAAPTTDRLMVTLEHVGTTKSFEKFGFPDDCKGVVVGNVYAPLGTVEVKVLIVGAGDTSAE